MSEINIESELIVVDVDMLLTLDALSQHQEKLRAAAAAVRQTSPYFNLLVRVAGNTMPRDVADGMGQLIEEDKNMGVRKIAVVQPSLVGRMQMRRISEGVEHLQSFETEAEARAWLAE